jgi:hypothetical protein
LHWGQGKQQESALKNTLLARPCIQVQELEGVIAASRVISTQARSTSRQAANGGSGVNTSDLQLGQVASIPL